MFTNLNEFLNWMVGPGCVAVVMWFASWAAENWPWWVNLPKAVKTIVPPVLASVLAVVTAWLLKYPDFINAVGPWFSIVMTAIIGWIASQKSYMSAKKSDYGIK